MNLTGATLFGRPRDELVGRRFHTRIHHDSQDAFYLHMQKALRTREKQTCELLLMRDHRPAAKPFHAQLESISVDDRDDRLRVVVTDITDRVHAQMAAKEMEERYTLAVQGMNDGIWDWDVPRQHVDYSPRCMDMLGYSAKHFGHSVEWLTALLHPDDKARVTDDLHRHLKGDKRLYRSTKRLRHRDGTYRWILCRATTQRDAKGRALRMTGSYTDVTAMKALEAELIAARDRAQAANGAKSDFLANMSHEIRTPLNVIIGIGNILSTSAPMTGKQQEFVSTLRMSADSLLALVNQLLDLSKIEASAFEAERIPFDLSALLDETVRIMSVKAQEHGLTLRLESDRQRFSSYLGDPHRLRQMLMNLIGNAIKFTPEGGVTLRVTATPGSGHDDIAIAVEDTGIGIPPERQPYVFDAFTQADASTTRRYGGTGLGLAICKKIAEHLGGRIELRSEVGNGSVFTLHLPLTLAAISAPRAASTPAAPPVDAAENAILIVEDYAANQLIVTTFLEGFSYAFDVASSGAEALEKLKSRRYAAILMDVQMQDMDGFEATRRIRAWEAACALPPMPILAMTAHAFAEIRDKCLSAGMNDYLPKPFDPEDLHRKIAALM